MLATMKMTSTGVAAEASPDSSNAANTSVATCNQRGTTTFGKVRSGTGSVSASLLSTGLSIGAQSA